MYKESTEHVDEPMTINSNEIKEVNHYIHLSQCISMDSTSKEQEIKRLITLRWQAFGRASAIFTDKDILIILKRQVYDWCIYQQSAVDQKPGIL